MGTATVYAVGVKIRIKKEHAMWKKAVQVFSVAITVVMTVIFAPQPHALAQTGTVVVATTASAVPTVLQGVWKGVFDSDGQYGGQYGGFSTGVKLTIDETAAQFELDTGATWKTPVAVQGEVILLYFGHAEVRFLFKKGKLVAVYDGEWNGVPRKNSIVLKK